MTDLARNFVAILYLYFPSFICLLRDENMIFHLAVTISFQVWEFCCNSRSIFALFYLFKKRWKCDISSCSYHIMSSSDGFEMGFIPV